MYIRRTLAIAITAIVMVTATGCAVHRGQETVGAYVDDTGITTLIKAAIHRKQTGGRVCRSKLRP